MEVKRENFHPQEMVVFDLNILGWLYKNTSTSPKKFDLGKEEAALLKLAQLENPPVTFGYSEAHFRERYRDDIAKAERDFPQLKLTTWFAFGEFAEKIDHFIDIVKDPGERQDDVEMLAMAAFFPASPKPSKRIKHIVTLDAKFINRLDKIHKRICRKTKLKQWVLENRPDFSQLSYVFRQSYCRNWKEYNHDGFANPPIIRRRGRGWEWGGG